MNIIKQNSMNKPKDILTLSQERFPAHKFNPEAVNYDDLDYIMLCV